MPLFLLLSIYCALVFASSVFGGRLSTLMNMTHLRTQLMMSSVGGLMLGIAWLHLFPHAVETLGSASQAGAAALVGLVVMFLVIRWFHTHDHVVAETTQANETDTAGDHDHVSHGGSHHNHDAERGISWAGLFFGLLLHTLVDGIALASSVMAEYEHGAWLGLGGLGTFLAIFLHKPLDAFAITSVMNRQNWSPQSQRWINLVYAMACPIGAMAFYFGVSNLVTQPQVLGFGLAVSAGFFVGIALADLLPEVEFHHHDRGRLTAAFLLGIGIAVAIENLPGHDHSLRSTQPDGQHDGHPHHGDHHHHGDE